MLGTAVYQVGLEVVDPRHEIRRLETGRARRGSARGEGGENRADEPVNVKQRHHVEAAVGWRKRKRVRDVPRREAQVGLRERRQFGPRGGAGGVQQQSRAMGRRRERVQGAVFEARAFQAKHARRLFPDGVQPQDGNAARRGRRHDGRFGPGFDDHGPGPQVRQVEIQLRGRITRVERSAAAPGGDGQRAHGRLRPVGKHDSDAVFTAGPVRSQRRGHGSDMIQKFPIRQRIPPQAENRGPRGIIPRGGTEQVVEVIESAHGIVLRDRSFRAACLQQGDPDA